MTREAKYKWKTPISWQMRGREEFSLTGSPRRSPQIQEIDAVHGQIHLEHVSTEVTIAEFHIRVADVDMKGVAYKAGNGGKH